MLLSVSFSLQVKGLLKGDRVVIEWKPICDLLVGKFLRRPDGELLVHYTFDLIHHVNTGYDVVQFPAVNQWYHQFNGILYGYQESGLVLEWKKGSINFFSDKYMETHRDELDFLKVGFSQKFHKSGQLSISDVSRFVRNATKSYIGIEI